MKPQKELEILRLIQEMTPPEFGLFVNCIPYTKEKKEIKRDWLNHGNGKIEEKRTPNVEAYYVRMDLAILENYLAHILQSEPHGNNHLFLKTDVEYFLANIKEGQSLLTENY